jgi:hypothetical protein
VVTLCTARFNVKELYVLPIQCIYVFCVDLSTNGDLFFITETVRVYCTVQPECLNESTVNFVLKGLK